jgi:hypothetical protein
MNRAGRFWHIPQDHGLRLLPEDLHRGPATLCRRQWRRPFNFLPAIKKAAGARRLAGFEN